MHPTQSFFSRRRNMASAAILMLALTGCGRTIPTQPASKLPAPSTGTGSLSVQASVAGSASVAGDVVTDFSAVVQDALGAPVSGATVRMRTPDGQVLLMETPGTAGRYTYSGTGYTPGIYSMDVISGTDNVMGAWVMAPNKHTVVSPAADAVVTAGSPLLVDWQSSDATEEVTIRTRNFETSVPTDPGSLTIPGTNNPVNDAQSVTVVRTNHATISGAQPGGSFAASFEISVDPIHAR